MRLDIQTVIDIYIEFGEQVFAHPRTFPLLRNLYRYDASRLETVLKDALNTYCNTVYENDDEDLREIMKGEDQLLEQQDHLPHLHRRCMTYG